MEPQWCICDSNHESVKALVNSFFNNCPLELYFGQDVKNLHRDSLEIQRFQNSYMNHVIRIRFKIRKDLGFIIKMSPSFVQNAGDEAVPPERGESEYRAYDYFNKIVPGCVPSPVFYDKQGHCLCTRELIGYRVLSEEVMIGRCNEHGARSFAARLAAVHSKSHFLAVGTQGIAELSQQFPTYEPLLRFIRSYHFEKPFDALDLDKRCAQDVKPMLKSIYTDAIIKSVKDRVKKSFSQDRQSLIHGDLHVDSVIVDNDDFVMVDAECVRVGPCAYDMGLLMATLIILYHCKSQSEHRDQRKARTEKGDCPFRGEQDQSAKGNAEVFILPQETKETHLNQHGNVLRMCTTMLTEYVEVMTRNLKQNHRFAENLLKEVVAFTGCELLGWIIGPPHLNVVDSSPPQAEVDCVRTAVTLLKSVDQVTTVEHFMRCISSPSMLAML